MSFLTDVTNPATSAASLVSAASDGHNVAEWANQGSGASNPKQETANEQPIFHTPAESGVHCYFPGVAGNYVSTPNDAAINPTGDFELQIDVQLDAWSGTTQVLVINGSNSTGQARYYVWLAGSGTIYLTVGDLTVNRAYSFGASGFADGSRKLLRFTWDQDNGSSQSEAECYHSDDGGDSWTQLGTTQTNASTVAPDGLDLGVCIGAQQTGLSAVSGRVFSLKQLDGIGGAAAFDVDFSQAPHAASSFVCESGQVCTVNVSGGDPASIIGRPVIRANGLSSGANMVSALDSTLNGGVLFVVGRGLGPGTGSGRIVSTTTAENNGDTGTGAAVWIYESGDSGLTTYYQGGSVGPTNTPWPQYFIASVSLDAAGCSRIVNDDAASTSLVDPLLASNYLRLFGISSVNSFGNIDIEHVSLYPTDDAPPVEEMLAYLVEQFPAPA